MAAIHDLNPAPDPDTMREALYALFRHAIRGMVEVGWTDRTGALNKAKQFDVGDLDDLVAFAARINANVGQNVYFSAGLRRTDIDRDHRASDTDVEAVAALKIDCDIPGCFEAAVKLADLLAIRPSLVHFTGNQPHPRGALWWVLEEPESDLDRVRAIEGALSRAFSSDPKVVNPSRVMRLPGSVAWPYKQGRVTEMTGALDTPTRPAPYTLDELASALRRAGHDPATERHGAPTATMLDFNQEKQSLELEALLTQAREPAQWHENALLSVAHLIGRQCPPDVAIDVLAPRLTLPGYTEMQTRAELRVMATSKRALEWVERARKEREAAQPMPTAAVAQGRDPFPLIPVDDMGLQGPPSWLVQNFIPERGFGVLYGASGTYKSFLALDLALTVAYGLPWRGKATEQAGAAYIAGEGTYGIQNRVLAWREHRGRSVPKAPFWLAPVAANFLDPAMVKLMGERLSAPSMNIKLIVVDTLARSFGGGDENSTQDMSKFVAACDYLKEVCGAFVLAIHHTGVATTDRARGSSALRAAADVELSVSRGTGEQSVILQVTKMKDAEDGARVSVRMVQVEGVFPATGEVVTSLVPVIDEAETPKSGSRLGKNERLVLACLLNNGPLKFGSIRTKTGLESGNLGRTVKTLSDKNFIIQHEGQWMVTAVVSEMQTETGD